MLSYNINKVVRNNLLKWILIFVILLNSVCADEIILKVYGAKPRLQRYDGWFEVPNIIIIYNINYYDELLLHEFVHYNCYHLFGDYDLNHIRCFTPDYNNGVGGV